MRNRNGDKPSKKIRKKQNLVLVRMRSPVQIRIAAPKSLENFGFQGFFVAIFDFFGVGQNVGQKIDPHRDPHAERAGKV